MPRPDNTEKHPAPGNTRTYPETQYSKAVCFYRQQTECTQEEFAAECDISLTTLQDIETGRVKKPRLDTIKKIVIGLQALGLDIDQDGFNRKISEYETPPKPPLNYTDTPYTEDTATGQQDLAHIANMIPSARQALVEIKRKTNSETRIVDGIGLILDIFQQFADQGRPFEISRFGLTMEALDSFLQEIDKKELDGFGSLFSLGDLKGKLAGFQDHLGKYYKEAQDGLVPNGWPQDKLEHFDKLQEIFGEIQIRKNCINEIPDTEKRYEALDVLTDLEIQLHRNPLHLKNINTIRARLEELDRDIFKELLITSQLLLGTYADQLPPASVFRDTREAPEMVVIPAGEFLMGSADGEGYDSERPQHKVTIPYRFAVGRYPVTFEEWDCYRQHHPDVHNPDDEGWGRDRRPVIGVSWDDTKGFLEWLEKQTDVPYRLLSEAQWEYACRAGTDTQYHFGDDEAQLEEYAWYDKNSDYQSQPVGQKKPNLYGLYDMYGNVWEWCEDHWHEDYTGAPSDVSAWIDDNDEKTEERVLRGGSWGLIPQVLRARFRDLGHRDNRNGLYGFRVTRTITPR